MSNAALARLDGPSCATHLGKLVRQCFAQVPLTLERGMRVLQQTDLDAASLGNNEDRLDRIPSRVELCFPRWNDSDDRTHQGRLRTERADFA